MDENFILKVIMKQAAYAENITGYKPERIILGINIIEELKKIFYMFDFNNIPEIIIYNMYVTIDYNNKDLIKVVPEIKM